MRTQDIYFADHRAPCIFPERHTQLTQTFSELDLKGRYPVIVLIGGEIDEQQKSVTHRAIQAISLIAHNMNVAVICGGTNLGVMAEIGRARWKYGYTFPLVGIAPEALVTWPGGPPSTKFLWWGEKRWKLEPHYSHFILVPGNQFGDESPWIVSAASVLSSGHQSVTILINGGEVSRKDVELSMQDGRPILALSRTGRLADELSQQTNRHHLITSIPANAEHRIAEVLDATLSLNKKSAFSPSMVNAM